MQRLDDGTLLRAVAMVPESQLGTLQELDRSRIARGLDWAARTLDVVRGWTISELIASALDPEAVDYLAAIQRPSDCSRTILRNSYRITNYAFADSADERRWCLEAIARHGGRACLDGLSTDDAKASSRLPN